MGFDAGTCAGGGASLCFGFRVRVRIRASCDICSRLCSHRRVAGRATFRHSCAGHPNGLIADPRLGTNVCCGVCSDIQGRSSNRSIPRIYPDLWCSGRVTV
jgi:hypothetical protein